MGNVAPRNTRGDTQMCATIIANNRIVPAVVLTIVAYLCIISDKRFSLVKQYYRANSGSNSGAVNLRQNMSFYISGQRLVFDYDYSKVT